MVERLKTQFMGGWLHVNSLAVSGASYTYFIKDRRYPPYGYERLAEAN